MISEQTVWGPTERRNDARAAGPHVEMDRDPAHLLARVAADYQIPPTAPQGDVRLASFGLGELVERTPFDRLQIEPAYGPAIAPEYGFYGE